MLVRLNLERFPDVSVIEATDGEQGLTMFQNDTPSLVLTDINMPKLDGFALIEAIRAASGAPSKTPVIVVTARGDEADGKRAVDLGADGFLTKPIRGDQLREMFPNGLTRYSRQIPRLHPLCRQESELSVSPVNQR